MATRKTKNPKTGELVDAEVIEIATISDPPIRISLEDGSELRLKTDVTEVLRFSGTWDPEGMTTTSAPTYPSSTSLSPPPAATRCSTPCRTSSPFAGRNTL